MAEYPNQLPVSIVDNAALLANAELKSLIYFAGLQNVQIINAKADTYTKQQLGYSPDLPVAYSTQFAGVGGGKGIPVYSDLTLEGCAYTDNVTGKPVYIGVTGQDFMNFQTCLLTVTQANKIIKTEIQGRDGTVKEYIGRGDATITIKGVITSKPGVYPFADVAKLQAWLDAPVSKGLSCRWLNNMGVFNVVVESYDIPQLQGEYSQQVFTINCTSDAAVALKIYSPIT